MATVILPAVLNPGVVLTTSFVPVVTSASLTQTIIKRAVADNVTGGSVTFSVTRTPSGGSPLVIIPPRTIAAGTSDLCPELTNMVLNSADSIAAEASAGSSINFFASGFTSNG